jgi:hypothetical protein
VARTWIVLYMSMSLGGFIAGPEDGADHPLGIDGSRLHEWFSEGGTDPTSHRPSSGPSAQVFDEMLATGAVITGRRTFDIAHQWGGDHHDGVQIFVLTRTVPVTGPCCCTAPTPRRSASGPGRWVVPRQGGLVPGLAGRGARHRMQDAGVRVVATFA